MIHQIMGLVQMVILCLSLIVAWAEAISGQYGRMTVSLFSATLMFALLIVGFV